MGNIDWARDLAKDQLYAALSQASLGAGTGDLTIARVPLRSGYCAEHGNWHAVGEEQIFAPSHIVDTPKGGVSWPPRVDRQISWREGSSERISERGESGRESLADSEQKTLLADDTEAEREAPSLEKTSTFVDFDEDLRKTEIHPSCQCPPQAHLEGTPKGKAGKPPPLNVNDLDFDEGGNTVMPDHAYVDTGYVDAQLNMPELTLTFQRHLAMLARAEGRSSNDSLRALIVSTAV